jgi:hypothetical protein
MPFCCSTFESAASRQFNAKKAANALKAHRDKGTGPTTRLLEEDIAGAGL